MAVFTSLDPENKFISLDPKNKLLPSWYDHKKYGEEPFVEFLEKKDKITITYYFPGFSFPDLEFNPVGRKDIPNNWPYKPVKISKAGFMTESGKPLMPSFGRFIQIPAGSTYDKNKVKKTYIANPTLIKKIDFYIISSQEELSDNQAIAHKFEYCPVFYSKNERYPKQNDIVKIDGPFEIDGYNTLLIHVRPLQYNPKCNKIYGYVKIKVTIPLIYNQNKLPIENVIYNPELNREVFGNFFINPNRGIDRRMGIEPKIKPFRASFKGIQFLIIHPPGTDFKNAAKRLQNWKKKRGLNTKTVSTGNTGKTLEKIKRYIRNLKKNEPYLRYVLLIGDDDQIPTQHFKLKNCSKFPTDYYYSTIKNPKKNKSDIILPLLSIGRIPANNAQEAIDVVNKIIKYEQYPPTDPLFYEKIFFAGYYQDTDISLDNPELNGQASRMYIKTLEKIRDHMIKLGFRAQNLERTYVSQITKEEIGEDILKTYKILSKKARFKKYLDGIPVPSDVIMEIDKYTDPKNLIIEKLNEGQLLTVHRGHGSWDRWICPEFTIGDFSKNEKIKFEPTIIFNIHCLSGKFDLKETINSENTPKQRDSFAEAILKLKHGVPSLISSTHSTRTWRNDGLLKALFDGIWSGLLSPFGPSTASYSIKYTRLGDILNYAKTYLLTEYDGFNEGNREHFELYHIIGDPTLEMWKKEPKTLTTSSIIHRSNNSGPKLSISLDDCPKGLIITIWNDNQLLKKDDTLLKEIKPTSTQYSIFVKDLFSDLKQMPKAKDLLVCSWAPGYRFVEEKISIPKPNELTD